MNPEIVIFDLDGTLTVSKSPLDSEMAELLDKLLEHTQVAVISGGSYFQFQNQFLKYLNSPDDRLKRLYLLPTSGACFYRYDGGWEKVYAGELTEEEKEKIKHAFSVALGKISEPPAVVKGEQVEDRGTQITFSALGQEAPIELKEKWDPDQKKRLEIKSILDSLLPEFEVRIGGTTSVDVTHRGIDKAYGIEQISHELGISKDKMLFVGDALFQGGNDEAATRTGVKVASVSGPEETKIVIKHLLGL